MTIFSFCSGATLAYTRTCRTRSSKASRGSAASSGPVMTAAPSSSRMPSRRAIARAVSAWAPGIITGTRPAPPQGPPGPRARPGRQRVVAGDHHRDDAGRPTGGDGLARFLARRVHDADEAEEGEAV